MEQARWRRQAFDGERKGRRGQLDTHVRAAVVGDTAARKGIQREGDKEPALAGGHVGEITLPDLARTIRRGDFGQPVLRNGMRVATVRGLRAETALVERTQGLRAHEPAQARLAHTVAQSAQIGLHAQRPVGLAAGRKTLCDERCQRRIPRAARTARLEPVRVKAALGHFKRLGQRPHGKLSAQFFHHCET